MVKQKSLIIEKLMKVLINADNCDRCSACVAICPALAIEIDEFKVVIEQSKCIKCLICIKTCPVGAIYEVSSQ